MARYPSHWIILTNPHITDTYAIPDGIEFLIAPNDNIKTGDIVYLWANPHNLFYAWGEVASTPGPEIVEAPRFDGLEKIKRIAVRVRDIQHFHPQIEEEVMQSRAELKKLIPKGFDDLCAIPLRPGQAAQLNDFIREFKLDAPRASTTTRWLVEEIPPQVTLQAVIIAGDKTSEGRLVEGIGIAWFEILKLIKRDPEEIFNIEPRTFEELIAGAYDRSNQFDEVILTPRSGDKGRDIIATKNGFGSIRIIDQIKRNRITHPVTADDVRALVGVLTLEQNVSKGVVTTSGVFAPNLEKDELIQRVLPYRLELRPRDILIPWLMRMGGM
jgi:restriction system protein